MEPEYCPICGKRPEIPFINAGSKHIFSGHCEKCQVRFTMWLVLPYVKREQAADRKEQP